MKAKTTLRRAYAGAVMTLALLGAAGPLQSCKDEVDASNLVTKTEATVWDYLDSVAVYADYADLLTEVETGDGKVANSSTLASFVSGYGNFTVFPATNEAIAEFTLERTEGATSDWHQLSADDKKLIAYNSIIDHGDDPAYATADFPVTGTFTLGTLDHRLLTVELTEDNEFVIEGSAHLVQSDVKLKNGYIHGVDHVIAPSQATVSDLIATADNMRIFSLLLERTGWADSMRIPYEDPDFTTDGYPDQDTYMESDGYFDIVEQRYRGFTVFAEPDSLFQLPESEGGWAIDLQLDEAGVVANPDEVLAQVEQRAAQTYGSASMGQYTDPANPLNCFVAYHMLDGALAYNNLVHHMNEFGYNAGPNALDPQLTEFSVDVWDYYTTMGTPRRLLKVLQAAEHDETGVYPIFLNTAREYDNSRTGTYKVTAVTRRGQRISATNGSHGSNSAVNGFYYPIDGIHLYSDEVRTTALRGRLRFDIATMTPEIWTANMRGRTTRFFTDDFFENIINVAEDTRLFYLSNPGSAWYDYQGDEFEVTGVFDVTFRLPPVPTAGTYEVRMGISNNTLRGMAQIYFGDNPQNLAPTGLPIDLRVCARGGGDINDYKEDLPDIFAVIPWETDVEDEEQNRTVEKNLRNAGYMKGPKYFHGHSWTYPARENNACLRRIITQQYMTPDKTYYIRYKTALEATDTQFFTDYFELCPSYIYNGPEPEDVW